MKAPKQATLLQALLYLASKRCNDGARTRRKAIIVPNKLTDGVHLKLVPG